jgi:uncharacterized protein with NRDE domain
MRIVYFLLFILFFNSYCRFISEWWGVMTTLNSFADAVLKSVDKHGSKYVYKHLTTTTSSLQTTKQTNKQTKQTNNRWTTASQDVESLPDAALAATGVSVARERTLIALSGQSQFGVRFQSVIILVITIIIIVIIIIII